MQYGAPSSYFSARNLTVGTPLTGNSAPQSPWLASAMLIAGLLVMNTVVTAAAIGLLGFSSRWPRLSVCSYRVDGDL